MEVNAEDTIMNISDTDPNFMEYALKRSLISRNKLAIILKGANGVTHYCCVECPARYEEKEKLELHLCMHTKEYRFLCGICGTGLKRKEHLERHTMEHLEVRPHVCKTCGKAFKRKEHLNIHQSIHNVAKSEVCSLCNRSFHRKDHLQKHLQTHSKLFLEKNMYPVDEQELLDIKSEVMDEDEKPEGSGDDMDIIEGLDSLNNSEYNGDSHGSLSDSADIRTTDPHAERPYVCEICFKSYKRKDHLKIHSWTHMKKDKVCSECGKEFHKEEQLNAHTRVCIQVHLKQAQSDQLDDDSQMESEEYTHIKQGLLVERRARILPESRPHACVVCGRRFKRKQHLKVHANVHLKQRSQTNWCSLCSHGFHSSEDFESHVCIPDVASSNLGGGLAHAPQEAKKENSNPAQFLKQELVEEEAAAASPAHALDEHALPVPQRVYVCRFCGKPFKRKDHYKIHLHIHTGVRSFFCQDCGKGFYRKDHLQKHAQVHLRIPKQQQKKQLPDLVPIRRLPRKVQPEITIHAPSNTKLRVPLQIKVPYQVVMSNEDGVERTVTIDPQNDSRQHDIFTHFIYEPQTATP